MARIFKACSVDRCNRDAHEPGSGRGWCAKHYLRWRRNGDPLASKINREQTGKPCKFDGCDKPSGHHGFCQMHYKRWKLNGDPAIASLSADYLKAQKWLADHASYEGEGCLPWPFHVNGNGRGTVTLNGTAMSAPRAMCTLAHGEPPTPEHETAHDCGKGHEGCIHPKHLRWATSAENAADKIEHGTIVRGEDVNTAKLTEEQVLEIRRLEATVPRKELADMFGVTHGTIWEIQTRRSWAWL